MPLNTDFDFVAHRLTDILDIRDAFLEIFALEVIADRPDRTCARALSYRRAQRNAKLIERPDLHGLHALLQQFRRQFARMPLEPAIEVLMLAMPDAGVVYPD